LTHLYPVRRAGPKSDRGGGIHHCFAIHHRGIHRVYGGASCSRHRVPYGQAAGPTGRQGRTDRCPAGDASSAGGDGGDRCSRSPLRMDGASQSSAGRKLAQSVASHRDISQTTPMAFPKIVVGPHPGVNYRWAGPQDAFTHSGILRSPLISHSARSASTGSMRSARSAGSRQATAVIATRKRAAPM